ncbi:clathrin heavy-chain terminal domain-containing protein, partial [Ramicandelaber brevisporus]
MAESLPIKFEEHMQLPALGINQACISFNNLTFESDKFICVRDTTGPQGQVVVVDLGDSSNLMRRNITADSAIMNPVSRIIALKAGRQLQVFNLELKAKVKGHVMNEDVVYWHWYSQFDLAIVTDTAVYHWSIEGAAGPVKVFDRLSQLAGHQIISYRVNAAANWMVLIGITMVDGRVVGNMQLFNKARGASQHIQGHAAAFAEVTLEGASQPTSLFAFSVRTETAARLHVVEIDHKEGNPAYPKKAVEIFFPPEAVNDFPVAMQVGKRYGIAYVVTKYGFIHLFDLETGVCVFSNRISGDTIFVTAEHESTSGILSINRKGQVLSVAINDDAIVPYILQTINNVELAFKLAARANLPGADDLYLRRFQQLMATSNYSEAARVAATAPQGILRTPQTIEAFK